MAGDQSSSEKGMSRRKFLKTAAFSAAAIAFSSIPPGESSAPPTPEKKKRAPKILQPDVFVSAEEKKKLASQAPLLKEMGITDPESTTGLSAGIVRTKFQAELFLTYAFLNRYADHGDVTNLVREKAAHAFNIKNEILQTDHTSITGAMEIKDASFDDLGNPRMELFVKPEKIDQIVAESDAEIVSMSFQIGSLSASYEQYGLKSKYPNEPFPHKVGINGVYSYRDASGNKITEEEYNKIEQKINEKEKRLLPQGERDIYYTDGYAKENAYENLSHLAALAKKYPNKIFIAASGNPYKSSSAEYVKQPNIIEAKARLIAEEKWSENIIIVGVEGSESGFTGPFALGADIYVNSSRLFAKGSGSSLATPIIAEAVRKIMAEGTKGPKEIKQKLLELSNKIGIEDTYQLFDFAKMYQFLEKTPFLKK